MNVELGGEYLASSPDGERVHRIYCADVLRPGALRRMVGGETLAALAADPPYCSGGSRPVARRRPDKGPNQTPYEGDARSDPAMVRWARTWLLDALELAEPESYLFVFSDWRQVGNIGRAIEVAGWHRRGLAVWDKTEGARMPHKGYLRHQAEFVTWGTAGQLRRRIDADQPAVPGVFRCPVDQGRIHQHQKPVKVWQWLFEILADRPGLILDPFAGSCSSVLAGDKAGRVVVAVDRSPAILEASLKRLEAEGFRVTAADQDPREKVLSHLRNGETVGHAVALVGRSRAWIYKIAANDNEFGARFAAARQKGV